MRLCMCRRIVNGNGCSVERWLEAKVELVAVKMQEAQREPQREFKLTQVQMGAVAQDGFLFLMTLE